MENKNTLVIVVLVILLVFAAFVIGKKSAVAPTPSDNNTTEEAKPQILGNKADLVVSSIQPGDYINGEVTLTASVQGGYFFEGNIVVNILDENKNVLLKSHGQSTSDWMTAGPVSFTATLDTSNLPGNYGGPAYIEIHNDNPSGMPEHDKNILIPITIT